MAGIMILTNDSLHLHSLLTLTTLCRSCNPHSIAKSLSSAGNRAGMVHIVQTRSKAMLLSIWQYMVYINCGVPQGWFLGSLLFFPSINDLPCALQYT